MVHQLNDPVIIKRKHIKNRICMPAMICNNWGDHDGFSTVDRARHYSERAKGGTGLIIIEASAVAFDSKIEDTALGIWKDDHIDQFARIAEACHAADSTVLVQIAHAGMHGCNDYSEPEIKQIIQCFIDAAVRAEKAGLDGIEIHGAHGFLINQFTSPTANTRVDGYGGCLENRLKLPLEILKGIALNTDPDFIISYRLGVNDLSFKEDIALAKLLETNGADLLNVSYGIGVDPLEPPADFKLSPVTYMATGIKIHVSIPVIGVNLILDPEDAAWLVQNGHADFAAVGRGQLADPEWANKAIKGGDISKCLYCRPWCKFGRDGRKCPRFIIKNRNK